MGSIVRSKVEVQELPIRAPGHISRLAASGSRIGTLVTERFRRRVANLPRFWKRFILIGFDFVVLSIALWLSFALRYSAWSPPDSAYQLLIVFTGPLVAIPIFVRLGLYRAVIRFLPERALWTMVRAMSLATIGWVLLAFIAQFAIRGYLPRSVPVFYWLFGIVFIAGSRFTAKALLGTAGNMKRNQRSLVIYGAGESGVQLAVALARQRNSFIAGFLDDDRHLQGRDVAGIRVFAPSHLPRLIKQYGVSEVVLSMSSLGRDRRQEILAEISTTGVAIRTLPPLSDVAQGKYDVSDIREIDIDELLGRSSVPPDPALLQRMIFGRSIMVTGAGGSIGSELCRLIVRSGAKRIVLFDSNEFALYRIDKELSKIEGSSLIPVLGSIVDVASVRRAITEHHVKVIFHAAAYKHVPLVESNALEGIRNNVLGTANVAKLARECGVDHFVLISSDKAVRPTNVMGATKRWAEMITLQQAVAAKQLGSGQRFCSVRFGNVLGSNGSVVPLFKEQIDNGGPLTLTDSRMTRYFMSIHEAAELIVQAGALSKGGDIFLLEMGESILIKNLAESMIRLAGRSVRDESNPEGDIAIEVIGARAGEKLFEELFYDPRKVYRTQHERILSADQDEAWANDIDNAMDVLQLMLATQDRDGAVKTLFNFFQAPRRTKMGIDAAAEC